MATYIPQAGIWGWEWDYKTSDKCNTVWVTCSQFGCTTYLALCPNKTEATFPSAIIFVFNPINVCFEVIFILLIFCHNSTPFLISRQAICESNIKPFSKLLECVTPCAWTLSGKFPLMKNQIKWVQYRVHWHRPVTTLQCPIILEDTFRLWSWHNIMGHEQWCHKKIDTSPPPMQNIPGYVAPHDTPNIPPLGIFCTSKFCCCPFWEVSVGWVTK